MTTSVTWEEPTVLDNTDPNPTITKVSGPDQGDVLSEGLTYVSYTSVDAFGNSNQLSNCTITLEVIGETISAPGVNNRNMEVLLNIVVF